MQELNLIGVLSTGGRLPVIEPKNITANGTYTAPEGVDGYSPVTVNVPTPEPSLTEQVVISNGTYLPPEGYDGFSKVEVDIPFPQKAYLLKSVSNLPQPIASFSDGEEMPMPSFKVAIEPQQDLHGYDAPWVGGAGKNKLNQANYNNLYGCTYDNNKFVANTMSNLNGAYIRIKKNDSVVNTQIKAVTEGSRVSFSLALDDTWDTIDIGYLMSATNISANFLKSQIGVSSGNITVSFKATKLPSSSVYGEFQDIQIEVGSSATSYAPYSNICPISGWDEVEVTIADDTTDPTVENVYTIDLDRTRYGVDLDAINGIGREYKEYPSYNGETLIGPWISDRDAYAEGTTPTIGAQVVDKGDISTFNTIPTAVKSLRGVNNVYANTGDITDVEYFSKEA